MAKEKEFTAVLILVLMEKGGSALKSIRYKKRKMHVNELNDWD